MGILNKEFQIFEEAFGRVPPKVPRERNTDNVLSNFSAW